MSSKLAKIPPSQKVAKRLRSILDYHGRTAADLAEKIGVTKAAVSQWLSATTAISPTNGQAIAQALDEDYEFVMGLSDKGRHGLGAAMAHIEGALGGDRLRSLERLSPEQFELVLELIDHTVDLFERQKKSEQPDDPKKVYRCLNFFLTGPCTWFRLS